MGNRAIVKPVDANIGVYLHYYGEIEDVTAFLEYCRLHKYRDFGGKNSDSYGLARFIQVVANYLGGSLSIGCSACKGTAEEADWLDNDIYLVDGWRITGGIKQETYPAVDPDILLEKLLEIDDKQTEKLGSDYIRASEIPTSQLKIGDEIYYYDPESVKTIPTPAVIIDIRNGYPITKNCGAVTSPTVKLLKRFNNTVSNNDTAKEHTNDS